MPKGITIEANFDGLVGPTHNYAGLSLGNEASSSHAKQASNPKQAALQGLQKMKALHDMGFVQGVLAPQERPDIRALKKLGFTGSDQQVIASAAKTAPLLLSCCYSASSMWTANAATVSPSADCTDGKVHFTPANLISMFHRSLEHETTGRILQATFNNPDYFIHHPALPGTAYFADEGAANHTRFCQQYADRGTEFFVYGKQGFDESLPQPTKYPARQTKAASDAVARLHQLNPSSVVYAQQNPDIIDQGVFHNDVIAVGNRNMLFCHSQAFLDQKNVYQRLRDAAGQVPFHILEVPEQEVSVHQAVSTYLFNSQLLSLSDDTMMIVVPKECQQETAVWNYLQKVLNEDNPLTDIKVFDLHQSMNNGGGPACLRLRVVLNEAEKMAVNPSCLISDSLFATLNQWVNRHYRDRLTVADLADPQLIDESRQALDQLTQILNLGSIYKFQE